MRILLVTHYYEPDSGAAAVRLTRLAKLLVARGHNVTVLATMPHYPQGRIDAAYRGKFSAREHRDGVRVVRVWLYATPSTKISRRLLSQLSFMLTSALRGLALRRPDVVLIEAQPVFTGLAGVFLSRLKRVPYVMNVSDFWPEYLVAVGALRETSLLYRVFKALIDYAYRGAAAIVTLYPPLIDSIEKRVGGRERLYNIYNGVDLNRFRPGLNAAPFREKHGLPAVKLVTFIGTFGTHIDFMTMLDAASRLNYRDDLRFVLVGTGGQSEKVRERLAQPDVANVLQIGWVDHDEMPLAWAASHVTFWAVHGHPLYRSIVQSKLYEAMASGVPVAIANEGLTADIVSRSGAGLTVPYGDSAALADAIARLADDTDFHDTCSRSARAYAETHLDARHVAEAYERVLVGVARHNAQR